MVATDISESLLASAKPIERGEFRQATAEDSGTGEASVDLVVVAQAIHRFDLEPFWREVARVLKQGGVFGFWGYVWPVVTGEIDAVPAGYRETIAAF